MIHQRLQRVIEILGWTQERLATEMVTSPSTVSRWLSGKPISKTSRRRIAAVTGVSIGWLETGKGLMVDEAGEVGEKWATPLAKATDSGNIAASINSGKHKPPGAPSFMRRPAEKPTEIEPASADRVEESFSMSEMVAMTVEVLESKTVYRGALASNVRAFHQAVKMEGEMRGVKEELQQMREEHRAEMEELKEMIRSLGGVIPEKREPAANA